VKIDLKIKQIQTYNYKLKNQLNNWSKIERIPLYMMSKIKIWKKKELKLQKYTVESIDIQLKSLDNNQVNIKPTIILTSRVLASFKANILILEVI
jgi:hypothetical protein